MPDPIVETPVSTPGSPVIESTDSADAFALYEQTEHARLRALQEEDSAADLTDAETGETVEDPEPSASAAVEATPAASQPESVPASEPETHQEQKTNQENRVPQPRVDEITKARREAEERADKLNADNARLLAEIETLKKPPAEPPKVEIPEPEPLKEPQWEEFEASENQLQEYTKALAKHWFDLEKRAQAKAEAAKPKIEAKPEPAVAEAAKPDPHAAELQVTLDARNKAAAQKYADYEQVVLGNTDPTLVSGTMVMLIQSREDGADIAYYLAKHPEEARGLAAKTNVAVNAPWWQGTDAIQITAREFDRISAEAAKPVTPPPATSSPASPSVPENTKPPVSRAPKPPAQIGGRASQAATATSEATSFEEYERIARQQQKRRW